MAVDRREPGRTGLIEMQRNPAVESPFLHSSKLVVDGNPTGWSINNDGILITLSRDSMMSDPDRLDPWRDIPKKAKDYPVVGNVFTTSHSPERYTLPTVATANALCRDVFRGLSTAGIKLVQTRDVGNTPVVDYVNNLVNNRLVVSLDPKTYLHDLLAHWLGAATTEKREFEVFKALVAESDFIGSTYGEKVKTKYIETLGHGFDVFSGLILDPGASPIEYNLPDTCLDVLRLHCPKALNRSKEIVEAFDTKDSPLIRSLGKRGFRSAHYDEVTKRLKQSPWVPQRAFLNPHG
jgi:hypothetical protein